MKTKIIPLVLLLVLSLSLVPVFASEINISFDVPSGTLTVDNKCTDSTTWHPGQLGEENYFSASGGFVGTYKGTEAGPYGSLNTFVNADAKVGSYAWLYVQDYQDFNVMSANHIKNTQGLFEAWASGATAEMDMKFIGSMYVWSEATNPYGEGTPLRGDYIEKYSQVMQNGVLQGRTGIAVVTNGEATMSNSNIWGWGISEDGEVYTDYGGGSRTITSTGSGTLSQSAYGKDYLEFNGFVSGSGGLASLSVGFVGGITGPYSMHAK